MKKTDEYSFQDASELNAKFEELLNRYGIKIKSGSILEAAALAAEDILAKYNCPPPRSQDDIRRLFRVATGATELAHRIVKMPLPIKHDLAVANPTRPNRASFVYIHLHLALRQRPQHLGALPGLRTHQTRGPRGNGAVRPRGPGGAGPIAKRSRNPQRGQPTASKK